jgi:AcrR family transcriptional regulator
VRTALVEGAARLLTDREPLTLRRLAAEVGVSTMAVYTHFGSMDELMQAVTREGFSRLADHLRTVPAGRDPVADLAALGWAYCLNAVENPDLYRAMFMESTFDMELAAFGAETFLPVVAAVERAIALGRLRAGPAWDPAVQMWAMAHGMVTLALAGMLSVEELLRHLEGGIAACLVGYGDEPARAKRSLRTARRRMLADSPLPVIEARGATLATAAAAARSSR